MAARGSAPALGRKSLFLKQRRIKSLTITATSVSVVMDNNRVMPVFLLLTLLAAGSSPALGASQSPPPAPGSYQGLSDSLRHCLLGPDIPAIGKGCRACDGVSSSGSQSSSTLIRTPGRVWCRVGASDPPEYHRNRPVRGLQVAGDHCRDLLAGPFKPAVGGARRSMDVQVGRLDVGHIYAATLMTRGLASRRSSLS